MFENAAQRGVMERFTPTHPAYISILVHPCTGGVYWGVVVVRKMGPTSPESLSRLIYFTHYMGGFEVGTFYEDNLHVRPLLAVGGYQPLDEVGEGFVFGDLQVIVSTCRFERYSCHFISIMMDGINKIMDRRRSMSSPPKNCSSTGSSSPLTRERTSRINIWNIFSIFVIWKESRIN